MASTCWGGPDFFACGVREAIDLLDQGNRLMGLAEVVDVAARPARHIHPGVGVMSAIARSGSSRFASRTRSNPDMPATESARARQSGVLQAVRGFACRLAVATRIPSVRAPSEEVEGPGSSSTTRMRPCPCGTVLAPVRQRSRRLRLQPCCPSWGSPSVERPLLLLSPTVAMSNVVE